VKFTLVITAFEPNEQLSSRVSRVAVHIMHASAS
jgi:hypothetical protein